jgi:hypothetical protein
MKSLIKILLAVVAVGVVPMVSAAGESPIKGGGPFGLGLELGDPGTWGAVGKFWIDRQDALQPAVKLGNGLALLQCDYLWHTYDVIHPNQGLMPLYFGAGADLSPQSNVALGARGVVGISYLFDRVNVPVDIYIQVVPEIWFYSGGISTFYLYGDIGSRYYF